MIKNIYITTFNQAHNDGALLQSYALQKYICDYLPSVNVLHIKCFPDPCYLKKVVQAKDLIYDLCRLLFSPFILKNYCSFEKFKKDYLCYTLKNGINPGKSKDLYITGSDQVWNTANGICCDFFLKPFSGYKISYAASLGGEKFRQDLESSAAELLEEFDSISVRESAVVPYLTALTKKDVKSVLDPVFLLDRKNWDELAGGKILKKEYVFLYITEPRDDLESLVKVVKQRYCCPIYSLHRVKGTKKIPCDGPKQFLNYIKYAKAIIGSSFHATAFSIIFRKDFSVLLHSATGLRVSNLLEDFGLSSCIITKPEEIRIKEINYEEIEDRISTRCIQSRKWLNDAITKY